MANQGREWDGTCYPSPNLMAFETQSPVFVKLLCIVFLCVSLYCLISIPVDIHAASQLDASPLCSVQQVSDCVHEIKVTVVSLSSSKSKRAIVTMPNGRDESFTLLTPGGWSLDSGTLNQLIPGQKASAREWRGKLIYFISTWQTKIYTSNDPHTGQLLKLIVGVVGILFAGIKLARS